MVDSAAFSNQRSQSPPGETGGIEVKGTEGANGSKAGKGGAAAGDTVRAHRCRAVGERAAPTWIGVSVS